MTLYTDQDPGGSEFLYTICNGCEADDTADENILKAKGWTWPYYEEPEGPHYCPDCSDPTPNEVDYDAYRGDGEDNPNYRESMKDAGRGDQLRW